MTEMLDNLKVQLCTELNEYSREGINSHEDLDMVKDILSSIKNIYRIKEHMDKEEWEKENERNMHVMEQKGQNTNQDMNGNSYAMRPIYDMSYAMNPNYGMSYAAPRRIDNSYAGDSDFPPYRGPYFGDRGYYITPTYGGYSGNTKEEMVEELKEMMKENDKPEVKRAISECITAIEK